MRLLNTVLTARLNHRLVLPTSAIPTKRLYSFRYCNRCALQKDEADSNYGVASCVLHWLLRKDRDEPQVKLLILATIDVSLADQSVGDVGLTNGSSAVNTGPGISRQWRRAVDPSPGITC